MIHYEEQLERIWPAAIEGAVTATDGVSAQVACLPAPVGAEVEIRRVGLPPLRAEVVGFRDGATHLFPFQEPRGVRIGDPVRLARTHSLFRVGPQLLGRVLNGLGEPLDGRARPAATAVAPLDAAAPSPLERRQVNRRLLTGVHAIDTLLACGEGQRTAIVAGPGMGKSVLLGMLARRSEADVNVVALIGERGREVSEFLHRDLQDSLQRSVVIAATGDETAAMRLRAAFAAVTVAEYFREQGLRVQLLFDSLTRVAMAQREIGLSLGELPAAHGFPPSVYSMLPRLLERTGASARGSVTAFYSVLIDGQPAQNPIGEAARGLLDGHIVLSPKLAHQGHFPAIDILQSASRLMPQLVDAGQLRAANAIRRGLAAHEEAEDLLAIGAYQPGTRPDVDVMLEQRDTLRDLLTQAPNDVAEFPKAMAQLRKLAAAFDIHDTKETP